jgi:putative ABC transport system permease protein
MKQLLNWFRRRGLEDGLDRELRYHFDRRVGDLVQRGLSETAARRQARLEMGGVTQVREEVRDVWLTRWMRDFVYDLRFSARSFLRSPSFTITTLLSLALGISAATAIYSLVDQVLLHSLPVRDPERLVLVDWKGDQAATGFGSFNLMSYPICRDLQLQDRIFEGVLCRADVTVNLSTGGEHKPAAAEIVSGTYFPVLGVRAALGRVLGPEDDRTAEASPVVVLAYDFWQAQLGGALDVVGRKVLVNQHPMTIAGVAAAGFRGIDVGRVPALWIPASMSSQAMPGFDNLLNRRVRWMQIFGRLKQGVTPAQARAGLQPWFKAMLDEDMRRPGFPKLTAERLQRFLSSRLEVTPAPQGHSGLHRSLAQPLWVLFAATGLLLGLACLNVAGLFLARGLAREREISTRLALGASRGRVGRQLLADSVLLGLAGGLLGLALAPPAMSALIAFLPRDTAANALHSNIDGRLLLFALLVSIGAGLASGFAPALHAGRKSLVGSLRERNGAGFGGVRLRKIIVTLQVAFSLILLIGAALFVRTLSGLMAKGPGFETSSLVSLSLEPRRNGYSQVDAERLMRRLYADIRVSPAIQSSTLVRFPYLTGGAWSNSMTVQADRRFITDDINENSVTPGFFTTMGVRMIAGRDFDERDSRPPGERGRRSAIINESFARRYFGGRSPIGARIVEGTGPDVKPNIEIVGIVADFNYRGLRDHSEQAFFSFLEDSDGGGTFYVKVRGTPEQAFESLRGLIHRADPALPIVAFRTVEEQVNRSLNTERMLATLSAAFGMLALALSLVGLYGVISFVVTQRTREIGIRMALGASGRGAVWLVLRDAIAMIAAGIAIALPCAVALGKLVRAQLFGIEPTDPSTIIAATLLLAVAALGAAFTPAYRASTVNPGDALRLE